MFGPIGNAKEVVNWTGAILALGLLALLAFLVWALVFVQVPASNKDAMLIVIGVVSNAIAGIVGWYFGTSYGSQKKTDAIERLTKP